MIQWYIIIRHTSYWRIHYMTSYWLNSTWSLWPFPVLGVMSVMSHTAPYSAARSGLGRGKAGSEPLVLYSIVIGLLYSGIQRYRCRRWEGIQPGIIIGPLYLGVPVVPERRGFPVFIDHSSRLSDKRVPDSPFFVYLSLAHYLGRYHVSVDK